MRTLILSLLFLLGSLDANGISFDNLSNKDVTAGLKQALNKGTANAVSVLGKPDGFFANERVKIPLPDT